MGHMGLGASQFNKDPSFQGIFVKRLAILHSQSKPDIFLSFPNILTFQGSLSLKESAVVDVTGWVEMNIYKKHGFPMFSPSNKSVFFPTSLCGVLVFDSVSRGAPPPPAASLIHTIQ